MSSEPAASTEATDGLAASAQAFDLDTAGRYQRLAFIGQGGMGRVFRVRDLRLGREVALKELLRDEPGLEGRLAEEVCLTAQLDHPGIVPIYDAGRTREGRCFYTMRLVRGRSLGMLLREAPTTAARLRLVDHVLDAARALAFAHERGVIHRDVKPDNVLLGPRDETQLADWGLACRVDAAQDPSARAGTAHYLSPERAAGGPGTRQSDVFALGVTLLEVLGGTRSKSGAARAPLPCGEVPRDAKTSASGGTQSGSTKPQVKTLALAKPPDVPQALWSIVSRALAEDPAERYLDAGGLADELAAWRAGRLVESHRYSPRELLALAVRAWKTPLLVTAAALAVTVVIITTAWQRTVAERERALLAERVADGRLAALLVQRAAALHAEGSRGEAAVLAAHALRIAPSPEAAGLNLLAATPPATLLSRQPLEGCRFALPLADETVCATGSSLRWLRADGTASRELPLEARRLAVSAGDDALVVLTRGDRLWRVPPDGAPAELGRAPRFSSGLGGDAALGVTWVYNPGHLRLFARGTEVGVRPCGPRSELEGVLADGEVLALLCSDGSVPLLEPEEWQRWSADLEHPPHLSIEHVPADLPARETAARAQDPVVTPRRASRRWQAELLKAITATVAVAPGRWLLGNVRGSVARLDLATGAVTPLSSQAGIGAVRQLLPLPEELLLVVGERGAPRLLDAESGALITALPLWTAGRAREDRGTLVLAGHQRSHWRLEHLAPDQLEAPVGLASAAISPDGGRALLSGAEGFVARWSLREGRVTPVPLGLHQVVKSVALSPDGATSALGAVELLGIHVERDGHAQRLPTDGAIQRVGWLRDGRGWALGYVGGLHFFSSDGTQAAPMAADTHWVDSSGTADGEGVVLLDAQGGVAVATPAGVEAVTTRPFAQLVVASGRAGPFITSTGDTLSTGETSWAIRVGFVTALALSPDGRWLAVGDSTGAVSLYEAPRWTLRARAARHTDRVSGLAFSAEGTLLSVGWDRRAALWSLAALDAPPDAARVERAWGVTLDALLHED